MSGALLDLEHLQQLSYERSKIWASFLDNVARNETHTEIAINDLEEVFGPEFDDQNDEDELASMEDDECDEMSIDSDILRNVTNTTRFSIFFNNKSVALPESTTRVNDENHKLADLFNQTLPIITEHHRQLKESGLDRILDTFDKKKIEEKVGSWLNRHNTLYGGEATLISADNKVQNYQKSSYGSNRYYSRRKEDASSESDDTLHSGETARYIRSSRVKAMKNASSTSTSTMIKTYRMIKSKREALREKYAFEQDDDETHLKAIRHRRRIAASEIEYNHYEHGRSQRSHKHETYSSPTHLQKRKVLRKRNICGTRDNSSDSDSYYYDKDDRNYRKKLVCCSTHCTPAAFPHSHRKAIKMPSGRSNRICYYSHSLSKSISSSSPSTSFTASYEKRQLIKRNKLYNDSRPCRRESECRCCNDRKLCQDYIHVADTSTEEWFVENCYSPKKPLKISNSNTHKPITLEPEHLANSKEKDRSKKTVKSSKSADTKPLKKNKLAQEVRIQEQKPKAITKKNKKVLPTISDDTFNVELQMAIEASKKLYEQEQKNKAKKQQIVIKEQREPRATKSLRKLPKISGVKDDVLTISAEQLQKKYIKQSSNSSTITSVDNKNDKKLPQIIGHYCDDDVDEKFVKPQPRSLTKSKKTKNSIITSSEEKFFAPSQTQAICNSTAIPNHTNAFNREFAEQVATKPLNQLVRKKVYKTEGAVEESIGKIKTNRKRPTTKCSIVKAKDDRNKEKIQNVFEHDESSLLKPVIKKTRKLNNSSIETKCVSNDTKECNKLTTKITASPTTSNNITTQNCDSSSKIPTSTVTSTTIRSPDTNSTIAHNILKLTIVDIDSSLDEHSDCTLVTSTTNIDPPKPISVTVQTLQQQQQQHQLSSSLTTTQQQQNSTISSRQQQNITLPSKHHTQTPKGILIYTPQDRSLVPAHSFSNDGGYFTINKEHLSGIIGEKPAEKFLKYYIGRRRFNSSSTIYFKPPSSGMVDINGSSSSESDDDLESLGQYGDLYESFNKTPND